ncbi:MAG TPA: hypothetical protein VMW69_13955 [Spirochaetia bacterium]|nr:hypothetical protein [Spirochaetia bacterium]
MSAWDFNKNGVRWNNGQNELDREISEQHEHNDGTFGNDLYYKDKLGRKQGEIHGLTIEEAEYLRRTKQ